MNPERFWTVVGLGVSLLFLGGLVVASYLAGSWWRGF